RGRRAPRSRHNLILRQIMKVSLGSRAPGTYWTSAALYIGRRFRRRSPDAARTAHCGGVARDAMMAVHAERLIVMPSASNVACTNDACRFYHVGMNLPEQNDEIAL